MKPIQNNRIDFFDTMRAILITLIVILHIFQVFNPEKTWIVYVKEGMNFTPILIDFLMLFTLQSFFIMSGYLAIFNIKKVGLNTFFDSRIKRILIPIIVTALTFNSLQTYLLVTFDWQEFTLSTYILEGQWVSHLWFLIDLTVFFFLTYISIKFFNPIIVILNNIFNHSLKNMHLYIILFIFSFITVILLAFFSIVTDYISNPIVNMGSIFFYFPFFLFGILIFTNKNLFHQFINVPIFITLILTILFVYLAYYFENSITILPKITYYFFNTTSNFFASALCFTFFHKYLNKSSKLFSFLSQASYSIYLLHHVLVVAIALLLIHLNITGVLGLILLFVMVMLITLAIHHYAISKIEILAFLYNGKKLKR